MGSGGQIVAGIDITPWEGISPFDDILEGAGDVAGGVIKSGFEYIVNSLFGGAPAELTLAVLRWLVAIPDFSGGAVRNLEQMTSVVALALLACVMTISVARYWGAGLAAGGGFAGIEGIGRGVVAVCAIAVWPFAFEAVSQLAGSLSTAVLSSEELKHDVAKVLATGVGIGTMPGIGLLFGIVIAVVGTVLLLALVGMKIIVSALTVVVFVGAPIAFVLWVIPELGWIATTATRVLCAVLAIPLVWALVFATFGALWSDTLLFRNSGKGEELGIGGSLADAALVKPMVALALLYLAVVVPKRLVAMAPIVGGGGGPLAAVGALGSKAALKHATPYAPQIGARGLQGGVAAAGAGGAVASGAGLQSQVGRVGGVAAAGATVARPGAASAVGAAGGVAAAGGGAALQGVGARGKADAGTAHAPGGLAAAAGGPSGSAPVGAGRAQAGAQPTDRYGGPKQAMTPERSEAISQSIDRMRRTPERERPDAQQVASAHGILPSPLRQAATKAATEAPSHEQARHALASWTIHPSGEAHRDALERIGKASELSFRRGVSPGSPSGSKAVPGQPKVAKERERSAAPRRDPGGPR